MGNELLESQEWKQSDLGEKEKTDLKFNLGTSYILQGQDLPTGLELLKEAVDEYHFAFQGFAHNNIGTAHFYEFIRLSSEISDP